MSWDDLFTWVQQLRVEQLPPEPWLLHPRVAVADNAKFLASLQSDAAARSKCTRHHGPLQTDLRRLHSVVALAAEVEPAPWAKKFVPQERFGYGDGPRKKNKRRN